MEIWRVVIEAPTYEVSNHKQIRNRKTKRTLKSRNNGRGLEIVDLRDGGFTITRSVNALHKAAFG